MLLKHLSLNLSRRSDKILNIQKVTVCIYTFIRLNLYRVVALVVGHLRKYFAYQAKNNWAILLKNDLSFSFITDIMNWIGVWIKTTCYVKVLGYTSL